MARQNALSLLTEASATAQLAEKFDGVIENVQKGTISNLIKNQNYSQTPDTGTAVVKRYANSTSKTYGTARTAGNGDKVKKEEIVVPIDINKEIVEEVAFKDAKLDNVLDLVSRRQKNHQNTMIRDLERAFFTEAYSTGTQFEPSESATTIDLEVEEAIVAMETTSNTYVDGIDRALMNVIMSPAKYSALRTKMDTVFSTDVNKSAEALGLFHGVRTYSSVYLPTGVDFMIICDESIAQPVLTGGNYTPQAIPLSDDIAIPMFYYYGTQAVASDMISYVGTKYSA